MVLFQKRNIKSGFMKSDEELGQFLQRLGELLLRGYSIVEAFDLLFIYQTHPLKITRSTLIKKLEKGDTLTNVLAILGVPKDICIRIYLSEFHGNIAYTLIQSGKYLIEKKKDHEILLKTIQYPMLLIVFLLLLLLLLRHNLLPQFSLLYGSVEYHPSKVVQIILHTIEKLPMYFILIIFLSVILCFVYKLSKRWLSPPQLAYLLLNVPIISKIKLYVDTHLFSRELSHLLNSGISMTDSLKLLGEQNYKPLLKHISRSMIIKLNEGISFSKCIQSYPYFRKELSLIVHHGEANGKLAEELELYSSMCLEELERYTKTLLKWIQPTIFLFIGICILLIYFSIMMPMFNMMNDLS